MSSEPKLDAWIASRKERPTIDLTQSVMAEIKQAKKVKAPVAPVPTAPPFLISSSCFVAGIGKVALLYHLTF